MNYKVTCLRLANCIKGHPLLVVDDYSPPPPFITPGAETIASQSPEASRRPLELPYWLNIIIVVLVVRLFICLLASLLWYTLGKNIL